MYLVGLICVQCKQGLACVFFQFLFVCMYVAISARSAALSVLSFPPSLPHTHAHTHTRARTQKVTYMSKLPLPSGKNVCLYPNGGDPMMTEPGLILPQSTPCPPRVLCLHRPSPSQSTMLFDIVHGKCSAGEPCCMTYVLLLDLITIEDDVCIDEASLIGQALPPLLPSPRSAAPPQ